MKKKLMLRIDEAAMERAKAYADERGTSVSKLVEQFFEALSAGKDAGDVEISPFVASLRGVAAGEVGEEDYRRHLEEKHR